MQPFADLAEEFCEATGDLPTIGIVYEQGSCQVSLLQVDQAESGRLAGAALGALAADRWGCDAKAFVALESGDGDPIGGARMQGYREGYREHCPLPRKRVRLSDAQHLITAQTKVASVLDDVSGRKIIVAGVSDPAALGALQAAASAGRADHLWAAGQLAEPAAREAIACDKHFVASVAQFPERFGRVAIPAIASAIDGAELPETLEAEMALVTAENVRELFPDTPACGE
jgi:ribose transport system substrate-binding protein